MAQTLRVLLWKTKILRKRRWITTLFELVLPILIFCPLIYLQHLLPKNRDTIVYDDAERYNDTNSYDSYKIAYTPANSVTNSIMSMVLARLNNSDSTVTLVSKANEDEVVAWLIEQYLNESGNSVTSLGFGSVSAGVGVVFSSYDTKTLQYTLRTTKGNLQTTEDTLYGETVSDKFSYEYSGFSTIQILIDQTYLSIFHNITINNIWIEKLPYASLNFNLLTVLLPSIIIVSFNLVIPSLVRGLVEEKASGIKEMTKIMGLKSWANWLNWVVYVMIVNVPVYSATAWLLTTDSWSGPAIDANFLIIWLLFFLFGLAFVTLIFALSCFFTNGTLALIVIEILWYVISIVLNSVFVSTPDKFKLWTHLLTCLWPFIPLQWSIKTINNFQQIGSHWTLTNLFDDGAGGGRISVGLAAIMLCVDIFFYSIITWYLENVKPGPFGRAKPLSFIFDCFKKKEYHPTLTSVKEFQNNYENPPRDVKVGIRIENLRKTFKRGKVLAVENVDLDIYEGNITALLGHNGAGKTTIMSIISGVFSPTRGKVIFKGQNIFDNMDEFRSCLGLCPQHNLLFSFFTVLEHLVFFGMLKGLPYLQTVRDGTQLLKTLKIDGKKNEMVAKLSGGMKRKLCLCIALMGDPEVLILDEPTSGLDPESRRQVWDILLAFRGQRTTIITTHIMEEADVLGDRIAIMDHGRVSCYGTSMFLKKLYGTGYHLNLSKVEQAPIPPITRTVEQYVTSASMKLWSPSEMSYIIKSEESHQFPELFSALENFRSELGLTGVSLDCTTMEDVFLKVAESPENLIDTNNRVDSEDNTFKKYKKTTGCGLILLHFRALVYKRLLTRIRSWITLLILMAIPILLMAYTINETMDQRYTAIQPNLLISLSSFPNVKVAASSDDEAFSKVIDNIVSLGKATLEHIPANTDFDSYFGKEINNSLIQYEQQVIAGFEYNISYFLGGYSQYFTHSYPLLLNMLANILLQLDNPSSGSSISVYNHPIAVGVGQGVCDLSKQASTHTLLFSVFMIPLSFGLLFLTTSFISFPLKERVTGAKQLQLMAGVSPILYWMTNFLADLIIYLITAALMVSTVFIFQQNNIYTTSGYMYTLAITFILFGLSGIAFAYFFSFLVRSSAKASVHFIVINIFLGTIAAEFITLLGLVTESLDIYRFILSFNPFFSVTCALTHLFTVMYINGACLQCGRDCTTQDPLQFITSGINSKYPHGIYNFLVFLAADAVLYFILVMMIEYGVVKKLWFFISKMFIKIDSLALEEDADVLTEKEKVKSLQNLRGYINNTSVLCVNDLGKKYNLKTTAVHGVTFQVEQGECFGLLGTNGAGKSTTFKMLTGEEIPNKGKANILRFSLQKQKSKFLVQIGYCPQFDAINKALTGQEILCVYAMLRGIPSAHCKAEVSRWIEIMGLKEYTDQRCGLYSGGNKRKLSTAIAFIGEPPVVCLDEPTSGVDPVSRRKLWDVMSKCQLAGQAIVLTSHSMEECEALCSRLTIMVAGQMKCIGSVQHLKHKFGQGYTIKIKLHSLQHLQNNVISLKEGMASSFSNCSIIDEHTGLLHYHIPDPSIRLSRLFTKMEQLKRRHVVIEDYIVSDTSLEQVFMSFAQAGIKTEA